MTLREQVSLLLVPLGIAAVTAVQGHWVDGPGGPLFDALRSALHLERLPLVAENLGEITAEVETLRLAEMTRTYERI